MDESSSNTPDLQKDNEMPPQDMEGNDNLGHVLEEPLDKALGERYLSYALSTIVARSLPDARDGLKPVHRRILYAMRESGNTVDKTFKKSASAVGYVMMKYHPHGDSAIYDALVRMAQPFSTRYPLILGQGNFGSIDGDNAAAMRYTEAKLSEVSSDLLENINKDAVDFAPSYNGESKEPKVLPTRFPNLLANGATGIAVGMATNIPPHNVAEICDALLHLIKTPAASIQTLMNFMQGPDFPTGGLIVEPRDSLLKTYETGRGSIRLRARYEVEKLPQGQYQIIVTEIPYQVQKSRLIEKIAHLWSEKKLPLLADIRDESTTDIRLIFTPKNRSVDPELLMESLFRTSDLEIRFSLNMNVLDRGLVPRVMNLREALQAFLNHRQDVLLRTTAHRIQEIDHRLEILSGLMIVYLNLDEVIRIIRFEDDPKAKLMERFDLSDLQVEAILNTRLKSLRKLEEMELKREFEDLKQEKKALEGLQNDTAQQWETIAQDLRTLKKYYGPKNPLGPRRTDFADAPKLEEVSLEAFIEREPVTVVCSKNGWIRTLKGHNVDKDELKYKEGDEGQFVLEAMTTDKLVIFDTQGRFYTLPIDKLPGGRGNGEPLSLMIELQSGATPLELLICTPEKDHNKKLLLASSDGRGFLIPFDKVLAQTKNGKQILNIADRKRAIVCRIVDSTHDHVAVVGNNRKLLIYKLDEIPEMNRGRGVILQKYREGILCDLKTFTLEDGLSWQLGDRVRTETNLSLWLGRRGQIGRQPPVGFPKTNRFV